VNRRFGRFVRSIVPNRSQEVSRTSATDCGGWSASTRASTFDELSSGDATGDAASSMAVSAVAHPAAHGTPRG